MKRSRLPVVFLLIPLAGCMPRQLRTEEDWRMAETRVESIGRVAGLLAADQVRERYGLVSEEGVRLARVGAALNEAGEALAADRAPEGPERDFVEEFIDEVFQISLERRPAVTEGLALARELAAEMDISPRARLWLALFCRAASRAILEVYEHELIDGGDYGDRAVDPVGDS